MNKNDLAEKVLELVESHWTLQRRALVLSSLPRLLAELGFDVPTVLAGRKLTKALEDDVPGVEVVRNEMNPIVVGLVPTSAGVRAPFSEYFQPSGRVGNGKVPAALWRAFTAPISQGYRRFVTFDPVRYVDLVDGAAAPSESHEVPRAAVIGESVEAGPLTYNSIDNWLKENGIDLGAIKTTNSGSQAPREVNSVRVLANALAGLDERDAEKIMVPLSVVRKIVAAALQAKK